MSSYVCRLSCLLCLLMANNCKLLSHILLHWSPDWCLPNFSSFVSTWFSAAHLLQISPFCIFQIGICSHNFLFHLIFRLIYENILIVNCCLTFSTQTDVCQTPPVSSPPGLLLANLLQISPLFIFRFLYMLSWFDSRCPLYLTFTLINVNISIVNYCVDVAFSLSQTDVC